MAVRFYIAEAEFSEPTWEPSNCSIIHCPGGGYVIRCLNSMRNVAEADTVDEADSALKIARLAGLKAHRKRYPEDDSRFLIKRIDLLERDLTIADKQTTIKFSCKPARENAL